MICAVCLSIFFYSEQNAVLPHHVHFFHVLIFYFRKQIVIWRMYGVLAGVFDNSLDHLDTWKRFAFSHYLPPMPSAIFQDGVTWCYPIRFPTVLTFVAWGLCCRGWVGEFGGGPRGRTLLVWELGLPPGWDSGRGGGVPACVLSRNSSNSISRCSNISSSSIDSSSTTTSTSTCKSSLIFRQCSTKENKNAKQHIMMTDEMSLETTW